MGVGGAPTMGKKRSRRQDDAVVLVPVPEGAESVDVGGGGAVAGAVDPGVAKRAKALRKHITSLDGEVTAARRRIERRRERLIDAERELRSLERELAAALREARAEGVEDPGEATARPPRRRIPRPAAAAASVAARPPNPASRKRASAGVDVAPIPVALPMPPPPAGVTPRPTRRRTPATGSRPAGGARRRPRDAGAESDTEPGPPS
jgi:hypothetical protein